MLIFILVFNGGGAYGSIMSITVIPEINAWLK